METAKAPAKIWTVHTDKTTSSSRTNFGNDKLQSYGYLIAANPLPFVTVTIQYRQAIAVLSPNSQCSIKRNRPIPSQQHKIKTTTKTEYVAAERKTVSAVFFGKLQNILTGLRLTLR